MWRGLTALVLGSILTWTASFTRAQDVPVQKPPICTWSPAGCSPPGPGCVCRLNPPNLRAAAVLSQLDIDGDGVPDNSADSDGDGLPDSWERGGEDDVAGKDMVVYFPAPSAIVPGTPPTPIFARRAVATDAYNADTDGDGLSDFVEVFGLMFIDDNHNGILDEDEWSEDPSNRNGLPNPGEYPLDQSPPAEKPSTLQDLQGHFLLHDHDGFMFTDPTNPDTDGDGEPDGTDLDPLINPKSFGLSGNILVRFAAAGDPDIDKDGLGNAMDMGNDLTTAEAPELRQWQAVDNPANLRQVLKLFRSDLLKQGVVPESTIEDLLGADWDGNGLWRTTDVREWSLVIDPDPTAEAIPPSEFFRLDPNDPETNLYRTQTFEHLRDMFNAPDFARYGGRGIGLGWQEILKPSSREQFPQFIPDLRIWAILYAWRMPGFDIDGDGFVGAPNISSTAGQQRDGTEVAEIALRFSESDGRLELSNDVPIARTSQQCAVWSLCCDNDQACCSQRPACCIGANPCDDQPFDDRIPIGEAEVQPPELNGSIEAPQVARLFRNMGCGAAAMIPLVFLATALCLVKWARGRGC